MLDQTLSIFTTLRSPQLVHFHLIFERLDVELEVIVLGVAVQLSDLVQVSVCIAVGELQIQEVCSVRGLKIAKGRTLGGSDENALELCNRLLNTYIDTFIIEKTVY